MSTQNAITLPRECGTTKYVIPAIRKEYSGGSNVFSPFVTKFLDGGAGKVEGARVLPKSLDNTVAITAHAIVSLPAAGSSGEKLRLTFAYHLSADGESKDPGAATQTVAVSADISTWLAEIENRVTFTLTASNFAGEDHIEFSLERDPTHADDNYANFCFVHEIYLLANY